MLLLALVSDVVGWNGVGYGRMLTAVDARLLAGSLLAGSAIERAGLAAALTRGLGERAAPLVSRQPA